MLILLPPSEGKADAGTGRRWAPDRVSLPELNPARERVLDALVALCAGPDEEAARAALGLSEGQRGELRRNARLREAATAPAERLYTGVLYEALDLASLPAAAQRAARRSIMISSGLWGAVRLADRIPPYRCPIGARLPGVGALSAYWRRELTPVLDAAAGKRPGAGPALRRVRGHLDAARRAGRADRHRAGAARAGGRRRAGPVGGQPLQQGDQGAAGPRPARRRRPTAHRRRAGRHAAAS